MLGIGIGPTFEQALAPGSAASIAQLFANGEQGGWWDPSDFTTMFQDSAGTTPVTAPGQPVGLIRDKSGRGNHLSQPTAGSRPVLTFQDGLYYSLAFDGVDDFMVTASINFGTATKMTATAALLKFNDASAGCVFEHSADVGANNGTFGMLTSVGAAANMQFASKGTTLVTTTPATAAAPVRLVVVGQGDIPGSVCSVKVNGGAATNTGTTQGTGPYGNFPLYVGRRGGVNTPFNGVLYASIIRGAASSAAEVASIEQYLRGKSGAF